MALPVVHLLAARLWAADKPELFNCPEFYLGAISPDAIHVRDGNDKSRKNEIHLWNWQKPHPEAVHAYWQDHFTPFDIGYGIHVLTDGIWVPTYQRLLPEFARMELSVRAPIYYSDTLQADFALIARHPEIRQVFDLIEQAEVPADHPLLGAHEFTVWRQTTLDFYRKPCPADKPVQFITEKYAADFIQYVQTFLTNATRRYFPMNNPVLQAIADRRSTRGFSDVQLTCEQLQAILDAALQSPSAVNRQPWHFSVVQNKELLDEFNAVQCELGLRNATTPEARARYEGGFNVFYEAPTVIFISLPNPLPTPFVQIDAGIAVQNIAIAAQGLGLGSVILGMPREVFASEKGDYFRKAFEFPEGYDFSIAISVGNNTVTKEAHDMHPEKISFIR